MGGSIYARRVSNPKEMIYALRVNADSILSLTAPSNESEKLNSVSAEWSVSGKPEGLLFPWVLFAKDQTGAFC